MGIPRNVIKEPAGEPLTQFYNHTMVHKTTAVLPPIYRKKPVQTTVVKVQTKVLPDWSGRQNMGEIPIAGVYK